MRKAFISFISLIVFLALGFLPSAEAVAGGTYTSNFPLTENPISEGGIWVGGETAGNNLWGNCQTNGIMAYGVSQSTSYGDPTAILTGNWGADQTVQASVKINTTPSGGYQEAEVRLRTTINSTAHTITGYEAYCSVLSSNRYCHIASWGGPNGVWVNLDECNGSGTPSRYLRDGDILKATVTGTNPVTITMYINGIQVMQTTDTGNCTFNGDGLKHGPWTSGNPGIGFYNDNNINWSYFGFSSFTASDGSKDTIAPSPPLNLRIVQ